LIGRTDLLTRLRSARIFSRRRLIAAVAFNSRLAL
jgi:hypothetical protein